MSDLQLNHICTYKLITEDNDDEIGMCELLYKYQLLQTFNMSEFIEDELNHKIDKLFTLVKKEDFVEKIIENHSYKNILDDELIFRTFFSYDYLDLFHKCLYFYFNKQPLDSILNKIIKKVGSK